MKYLLSIATLVSLLFTQSDVCSAQWLQTSGPEGGAVTSIAFDDTNIYVGTYGGGVFRSTNEGSSWIAVNTGLLPNANVESLHLNGATLFAGTDEGSFVTTNQGATWQSSAYPISSAFIEYGKYLINGVRRSSDNGATWTAADSGIIAQGVFSFTTMGVDLFAGTNGGVFLSTDSGNSWKAVNNGLTNLLAETVFASEGNLFVGTFGSGIFRSTDSGKSWTSDNQGISENAYIDAFISQGSNLYAGANGGGVFLSTDSGRSWSAKNFGLITNEGVTSLDFIHGNLIAGTDRGVLISSDGGDSWRIANQGMIATRISALAEIGNCIFAASGEVFRSTDNGTNWTLASNGLPDVEINALTSFGSELFVCSNDGLFFSKDSGASWIADDSGLPEFSRMMYALAAKDSNLYVGTFDSGVFVSTNNGISWAAANGGLSNAWIHSFAVNGDNLYADIYRGGTGAVARSTNNGISWNNASDGLPAVSADVNALAVSGTNLFAAAFGAGVYRSTDSGTSWLAAGNGLPNGLLVNALATSGANLFVGGAPYGVYLSNNDGTSWTSVGTGIPLNMILTTLLPNSTNLFTGTQGTGVWRRPLSDFGISSVAQTPATLTEIHSYPNPFSQSTAISFTSEAQGYADVRVVNLLGAQVAQLFSGELPAGEHEFSWDASGFAPGMYECVVRVNGQVQRISMMHSQ